MGRFADYYNRPGPGVDKDEPKKTGLLLYLQRYFRHFKDFLKENFMFILVSIPQIVLLYFMMSTFDVFSVKSNPAMQTEEMMLTTEYIKLFMIVLFVTILGAGPTSASMAYMMKCITQEKPVFFLSDFFETYKDCFIKTSGLFLIDILAYIIVIPVAIKFYFMEYLKSGNVLLLVLFVLVLSVLIVYTLMHNYFYQFIVSYELKFKDAIKNSLIMAIAYFPQNFAITLLSIAMTFVTMFWLSTMASFVLLILLWVSFARYPIEFLSTRLMDKKLIIEDLPKEKSGE